jgi:hypothetical protein
MQSKLDLEEGLELEVKNTGMDSQKKKMKASHLNQILKDKPELDQVILDFQHKTVIEQNTDLQWQEVHILKLENEI